MAAVDRDRTGMGDGPASHVLLLADPEKSAPIILEVAAHGTTLGHENALAMMQFVGASTGRSDLFRPALPLMREAGTLGGQDFEKPRHVCTGVHGQGRQAGTICRDVGGP